MVPIFACAYVVISDIEATKGPAKGRGIQVIRSKGLIFISLIVHYLPLKCRFNSLQCRLPGFTLIGRLLL